MIWIILIKFLQTYLGTSQTKNKRMLHNKLTLHEKLRKIIDFRTITFTMYFSHSRLYPTQQGIALA
jgi:hypothetical protein